MLQKILIVSGMGLVLAGCNGGFSLFGGGGDYVPATSAYVGTLPPDSMQSRTIDPATGLQTGDMGQGFPGQTMPTMPHQPVAQPTIVHHQGPRQAAKLNAPLPSGHGAYNAGSAAATSAPAATSTAPAASD